MSVVRCDVCCLMGVVLCPRCVICDTGCVICDTGCVVGCLSYVYT